MKKKLVRIVLAVTAAIILMWTVWSNVTIGVTHYAVSDGDFPVAFDHYRIALVSDLHNARFGEDNNRLITLVEKEKPDMIAVTGDLVDSSKTDIAVAEKFMLGLVEIAPCYYVTGNHEAWLGAQYQELEKKLLDTGVVVLHDRKVKLAKNNETIQLAGLDDPSFTGSDPSIQESMLKTKLGEMNLSDDYCVLLSHRPELFNAYVSANVDLVLSGHAHGGQFRLPFVGGIIAPNQGFFPKYDAGKFFENNTTMVVSRGIGNSIIPIRVNNRPEIVIVELLCEDA